MTLPRNVINLLLLTILASVLCLVGLGSMGLTDRDEGRNAEAGREMLESGDWISPTFNYEPRYAKPVLVYWLMALSYRLFGVTEFAARFPSALFGIGLILMQYLFLTRFRGPVIGLFAALMLLLNIEIVTLSRMALTDSVLIFLTTLSLYSFWLGFQGTARERTWLWIGYLAMALATLAKGPVGFLVPLVTIILFLSLTSQWGRFWKSGHPIAGLALFVAVALPWYAVMWSLHGPDYAASAQANTVGRFLNPMEGHGFTILFYLPILFIGFFPWSGWLPFAWYAAFKSWRETRGKRRNDWGKTEASPSIIGLAPPASHLSARDDLDWFAALWVLGTLVFFTLSSTRLPHYIGPLFPAAALLTASFWHRCLQESETKGSRASIHTVMGLGFLLAVLFASLPWVYDSFLAGKLTKEFPLAAQVPLGNGPYMASTILLAGTGLVGYFGLSDSHKGGAFWAAGGSLACVALVVIQFLIPTVESHFIAPPQKLAYSAGLILGPHDQFIVYGSTRPSMAFYARRKVLFVPSGEEDRLHRALSREGHTMILLPKTLREKLPGKANVYQLTGEEKGYLLLDSQPVAMGLQGSVPPSPTTAPPILGH